MRAILCTSWGEPEQLVLREIAEPEPGPGAGELAIDVHACSVNFADLLMIGGTYQTRPALPFVPGLEAAGTIASAPAGAGPGSDFAIGERVVAFLWHGGYAERAVAAAAETFRIPPEMSFATAAAFLSVYTSADLALRRSGQLVAGETVLVLGASGGVGLAAVQLGKAIGARVIALVSKPERAALARQAGADHVVCAQPGWKDEVLAAAGPDGVNVCLDPVGGPLFDGALSTLGWGGRYVLVGFAAGQIPQIPANRLLVKHRAAVGCSLRYFRRFVPAALRASVEQLFTWHQQRKLVPLIGAHLPLHQTGQGLRALADRRVAGKIVIAVREPDERIAGDQEPSGALP
jgi:NADPH2:quinone reductase